MQNNKLTKVNSKLVERAKQTSNMQKIVAQQTKVEIKKTEKEFGIVANSLNI